MNRSNFEIAQARVRQRRLYFMAAFVVGGGVFRPSDLAWNYACRCY